MARVKVSFDRTDMRGLVDMNEEWVRLCGKRRNTVTLSAYFESMSTDDADQWAGYAAALDAYYQAELSGAESEKLDALDKGKKAEIEKRDAFLAKKAGGLIADDPTWGDLSIEEWQERKQTILDQHGLVISGFAHDMDVLNNKRVDAGVSAYRSTRGITATTSTITVGTVIRCPFKDPEQTDLYLEIRTGFTDWYVYKRPISGREDGTKAAMLFDHTYVDQAQITITSLSRARQVCHAYLRGFTHEGMDVDGLKAVALLANGKAKWSSVGAGGLGRNHSLAVDVGKASQWVGMNVDESTEPANSPDKGEEIKVEKK